MSVETASKPVRSIIEEHRVHVVYQPIVDLDTGAHVAFESLARGPAGTDLEPPIDLFDAAEADGLTAELDWECRDAALREALRCGLSHPYSLFINSQPAAFRVRRPAYLDEAVRVARTRFPVIVDVSEHWLVDDPVGVIATLGDAHSRGFRISLDDVGSSPHCAALVPLLDPDVIKLDLPRLDALGPVRAAELAAVLKEQADRSGALILAEGIESAEDRLAALAFGARLGQGWFYGRPGPLAQQLAATRVPPMRVRFRSLDLLEAIPSTPFELVARCGDLPIVSAEELAVIEIETERKAERAGEDRGGSPIVLRSDGHVPTHHPLARQRVVAALGPHHAAALVARELGDGRYEYAVLRDRDAVVRAARSLVRHVSPRTIQL